MALDTTVGGSDARAYASATDLDAYATDYGRTIPSTADTAAKESALRQGALMLGFYAPRWPGSRANSTQALDWPRANAAYRDRSPIGSSIIPREVIDANCEAAIYALANPDSTTSVIEGLRTKREQVGSVVTEFFAPDSGSPARDTISVIDDLLSRLLTDAAASTGSGSTSTPKGFTLAGGSNA